MENNVSISVNIAIIMGCVVMAIVFLSLPLPKNSNLKKYKLSLRFLAFAYLTLAFLKAIIMKFDIAMVDILSMERLTISSLQATLFAIALIILINPRFITITYLIKQITPVALFNIIYFLLSQNEGYLQLETYEQLIQKSFQPTVLIREIFVLYYVFQLIYLTSLFLQQFRNYREEINNYFSEGYHLYLPWVKYSYYAVLLIGIGALLSCFILSELWMQIFTIVYGLFYMVFGIYYIQYPNTFVNSETAIYPKEESKENADKIIKKLVWNELKNIIIEEKYYLKTGVNIEDMARFLKVGRTTLSMFINNEEGMNFNMWINSLRIEEAKKLFIEYPNHNLIEISEMVGYSESSNFSRQFKIITNVSPSLWRQTRPS